MSLNSLIATVHHSNALDRIVLADDRRTFVKGRYGPVVTPACLLSAQDSELNRATWDVITSIFSETFGRSRTERVMSWQDTSGAHSAISHRIRHMIVVMKEIYSQDIVDAFRALKIAIHYPSKAQLTEPLQLLLQDSSFTKALTSIDYAKDLPEISWQVLKAALSGPKIATSYTSSWGEAPHRLKTGTTSQLSSFTYETGVSALGIRSLKEREAAERVYLAKKMDPEKLFEWYYLLAKGFSYREMDVGLLIKGQMGRSGLLGYYEVYKKIVTGGGMVVYALRRAEPSMAHLTPIILFRGTSTAFASLDSMAAVLSDIEPLLGQSAYLSGKERLFQLLNDPLFLSPDDKEVIMLGHSLGGTLIQFFLHDIAGQEERALGTLRHISYHIFNGAAVSKEMALAFARHMGRPGQLSYSGTIFKAEGDPANYVGECFLGIECPVGGRLTTTYQYLIANSNDPHCDLLHLEDPRYPMPHLDKREITDQEMLNKLLDNTHEQIHHILEFIRLWIARPLIYLLIWPVYQLYIKIIGNRGLRVQESLPQEEPFSLWFQRMYSDQT